MKLLVGALVLLGWLIAAAPIARAQDASPGDAAANDAASGPDAALPALDDGDGCGVAGHADGTALALVVTAVALASRRSRRSRLRRGR